MIIKLVSKKGSKAARAIRQNTSLGFFKGNKKGTVDLLVNYGLAGAQYDSFMKTWPSAKSIPMINRQIGYSKYTVCQKAEKAGIAVPESRMSLGKTDEIDAWIEKRTNSIGGIGIKKATHKGSISGKYYQRFIPDRRYELRVHAFSWIPEEEWRIQKRVGDQKEIAWNYKNGGHFITVNNPRGSKTFIDAASISKQILDLLDMSFGAVDFLVDSKYNIYFVEINSAPGFSELSQPIYVDAFNRLSKLNKKDLLKIAK